MRRTCHEIDFAIAQRGIGLVDRKHELDRCVYSMLGEFSELNRRDRGEVRGRDEVGDCNLNGLTWHIALSGRFVFRERFPKARCV